MTIETHMARRDWADRVLLQAEQMLIIAAATNDDEVREELFGYAVRLEQQALTICQNASGTA